MVDQIKAFKCGITGAVYEERERAVKSEFRAMMAQAGGALPGWGSISPIEMMKWLSSQIESGAYPIVADRLIEALQYWKEQSACPSKSKE